MKTRVLLDQKLLPDPLDPACTFLDVEVPEGWYRVWRGAVCPGDRYLHCLLAKEGITHWVDMDAPTLAATTERESLYRTAGRYGCLIRRGTSVEEPCERCRMLPREPDWTRPSSLALLRYCNFCSSIVLAEGRARCR